MSRIYTREDYEGVVDDWYTRKPHHAARAELIAAAYTPGNRPVVVAGCGYGFLVDELMQRGFPDTWGFDASPWAVENGAPQSGRGNRIMQADLLASGDMTSLRQSIGRFGLVVTEDVLPCMANEAEVHTALANLRNVLHAQGQMMHFVTPRYPGTQREDGAVLIGRGERTRVVQMPGFLWLTGDEWRALIGPGERIFLTHGHEEVP